MPPARSRLLKIARDVFGYRALLPGQERALVSATEGRDTLVVMPTGAGKSAIYQIAALALEGPAVVVSPLIALQRDQVDGLHEAGVTAAVLNSTLSENERAAVLESVEHRELTFLFLAPEQLTNEETLGSIAASRPSLFVVDEAHCISAWGHDFRPDYMSLGAAAESVARPPILALTATASHLVRDEIVDRLRMDAPEIIVSGFDRPNLQLGVTRSAGEREKTEGLTEWVISAATPGIVYVATRAAAEELSARLWERGLTSVYYHGAMTRSQRDEAQQAFMDGRFQIVVATSAFGMGIDKQDIRFVAHHDIPDSIDSYYQEIGRAGRDGQPARAELFYRQEDLGLRRFFASGAGIDADVIEQVATIVHAARHPLDARDLAARLGLTNTKLSMVLNLLERVDAVELSAGDEISPLRTGNPSSAAEEAARAAEIHSRIEQSRLDMMRGYAETSDCRRGFLLNYFGEDYAEPCGNCDNCASGSAGATNENGAFELNQKVIHRQFGPGSVVRHEDDKIVVLFEREGYKTLALSTILEKDLLKTDES